MKAVETDLRWLIAVPLVVFLAVNGVSMWFVDLVSRQGEFASLMGAELVAFALLLYLERMPGYARVSPVWILSGCALLAVLLAFAIL